jgi:hypothetical protein
MSYSFGENETQRRADARSAARASLGEEAYETNTRRGAAMRYDDVALLAIGTLDELLSEAEAGDA